MARAKKQAAVPDVTLVPAPSTEEQLYAQTLGAITGRKQRLGELEHELRQLRAALVRFEAVTHVRVGDLLEQLRDVAAAISRYERRLDPSLPPEEFEPPFNDEELTQQAEEFGANYQPPDGRSRRPIRHLLASEEAEAKRIYKDLARRFHPDLAVSDDDRRQREAMMQSVNEAYRARDVPELRSLYVQAEAIDPTFGNRPIALRLAWARAELVRLNAMVDAVNEETAVLRGMEVHRLWRRYAAGEPVLDQLEDQLEDKLAAQGRRLDLTIAAYRRFEAQRATEQITPAPAASS